MSFATDHWYVIKRSFVRQRTNAFYLQLRPQDFIHILNEHIAMISLRDINHTCF